MLALCANGFEVLVPFGENARYDLVIDDGVRLSRVQCKTGRLRGGAVRFATCSFYGHHPNPKSLSRDYLNDIDHFAVHCPETNGVYLIPIADLPLKRQGALRVDAPRNNQRRGIRPAERYEIAKVSCGGARDDSTAAPGAKPGA
jgi:PD-(D/E)XK nuclease superfamily protein